jgi:uncharacterized protein (DUF305 family)
VSDRTTDSDGTRSTGDRLAGLGLDDVDDVDGDEVADGGDDAGPAGAESHGDGGDGAGGDDADEGGFRSFRSGLTWPNVAVLGLALLFLGFAVGLFVRRDTSPSASSVDVGFYQDMTYHHEQALEMATIELGKGTVTEVRNLAMEVLNFQAYEIGWMDHGLQDWGFRRRDDSGTAMAWMGMELPVDQMPGLATEEQMDAFRAAEGSDVDAQFLELMAAHHLGGLHMAEFAAANAESGDVREWAGRMARNQAIEINEYAAAAERSGLPVTIEQVEVPGEG